MGWGGGEDAPGDLLLDEALRGAPGLREQVEYHAREVMRVAVRVPQVVRQRVQELLTEFSLATQWKALLPCVAGFSFLWRELCSRHFLIFIYPLYIHNYNEVQDGTMIETTEVLLVH